MATRVKREKKFFRQCPSCDKQVGHVSDKSRSMCEGRTCTTCSNRRTKTGVKRKPFSDEHKARIGIAQGITLQKKRDAWTKLYGKKAFQRSGTGCLKTWGNGVKDRDNYTCARCDTVATGYNINAHHIIPKEYFPERAFDISNGVTLCAHCHQQIHAFLDKLTLSEVKLDAEGFQTHTSRFINGNKATNVPTEYKPVFSPSVTITTE